MATKAKVTGEGLLIPKEVTNGAFGRDSAEVEVFEEPGWLLISAVGGGGEAGTKARSGEGKDPILALGKNPVKDVGTSDASVNHDRYLYTGG